MTEDLPDLCTAGLNTDGDDPLARKARQVTGMGGMLHCSLPRHQRGSHKAFREHDTSRPPPLFTWPFQRDDQKKFATEMAEVDRLASMSPIDLRSEKEHNLIALCNAMAEVPTSARLPKLRAEQDRIEQALMRQAFSG